MNYIINNLYEKSDIIISIITFKIFSLISNY